MTTTTTLSQAGHEPLQVGDWVEAYDFLTKNNLGAQYQITSITSQANGSPEYWCDKYKDGNKLSYTCCLRPVAVLWAKVCVPKLDSNFIESKLSHPSNGCICKRCNALNPFAVPNQKDGVNYICFECR